MSYCECGGWLGSGGVDSYSGRYCCCQNPRVSRDNVISSSSLTFNKDLSLVEKISQLETQLKEMQAEIDRLNKVILSQEKERQRTERFWKEKFELTQGGKDD